MAVTLRNVFSLRKDPRGVKQGIGGGQRTEALRARHSIKAKMLADQSPLCFSSLADYSVYPVRWGPLQPQRRREMPTRLTVLRQIYQKESRLFMINSQQNLHHLKFKFKTFPVRVGLFFVSFVAHSGKGGCGTFYAITVSSPAFQGLSTLKQHKLVTETLKQEIVGIHGLQVPHSSSLFVPAANL